MLTRATVYHSLSDTNGLLGLFFGFLFVVFLDLVLAFFRPLSLSLVPLAELLGFFPFAKREIFNCWPDTQTFFKSLKISLGIPSGKSTRL